VRKTSISRFRNFDQSKLRHHPQKLRDSCTSSIVAIKYNLIAINGMARLSWRGAETATSRAGPIDWLAPVIPFFTRLDLPSDFHRPILSLRDSTALRSIAGMPGIEVRTLKAGQDGDPATLFAKVTGFGHNDMISLPTLTKDSILDNLKRRFKVRTACLLCLPVAHRRSTSSNSCAHHHHDASMLSMSAPCSLTP